MNRPFISYFLIGIAILAIVNCEMGSVETIKRYACENGESISIKWVDEAVEVRANEDVFILPQVISASGVRYSDDIHEAWEHQGEIRWTNGSKAAAICVPQNGGN